MAANIHSVPPQPQHNAAGVSGHHIPSRQPPRQGPQHAAAEPEHLLLSASLDWPGQVPAAMSFTGGKLKLKGGQSLGGVNKKKKKKRKAAVEDDTVQQNEGQELALSTAQVGEEHLVRGDINSACVSHLINRLAVHFQLGTHMPVGMLEAVQCCVAQCWAPLDASGV